MLSEVKLWARALERTLTEMAAQYGTTIEEMDDAFDDFYFHGGSNFNYGDGMDWFSGFKESYALIQEEKKNAD